MIQPFRLTLATFAAAGLLSLSLGAIAAPPHGKGKPDKEQSHGKGGGHHEQGGGSGKSSKGGGNSLVRVTISSSEARRIAYNHQYTGYERLPPGIRKNLARGKPIPPGLAHRAVPPAMLAELPVHAGHEWRVYGGDLVLVAIATAVIADVLFDVFD